MKPGDPEYEARVAADIARLQAARGIQVRAWLRENKRFGVVLAAYLGIIALYAGIMAARGEPPIAGVIIGVFFGPIVMLRVYARSRRRR